MMEGMNYTGNEVFQLLVNGADAAYIVEDWSMRGITTDLRVRRAKTKGKAVIETTDVLFAKRLMDMYGAKVNIKNAPKS